VSNFIPPYPPRLPHRPGPLRRLLLARQNFLAMWEEAAFEIEFGSAKVLNRHIFICNSPEAVQFAFSLKNASFERKSPQMRHALEPLLGDGLFVSDGETWRRRRRIVAPIVHISRLSAFAPVMVEAALEARQRWQTQQGQTIDILAESAQLTAEIISRTIFGRQLGRDHARQIVDGFSEYQRLVGQLDLLSLLGLPDWLPRWHSPAVRKAAKAIQAVIDDVIASYRSRDADEASIIGGMLRARDEETGAPLDPAALRNEAAVLFMAGHETTANSLAWTWYLLSQAPDAEARLHAELDAVLGGRPPTLADVPRLVYTRAVFDEALRLYPPVPLLPREALKTEQFKDWTIPRGSVVLVVPWLLHRHKLLWQDPDHFTPERFLPENAGSISKFAYVPFSTGPRVCAGLAFGATEAVLCLATLAQAFRLRLQPGYEVRPVCRLTLRPEGGVPMTIVPRHAAAGMPKSAQPVPCHCEGRGDAAASQ
jgi:cytochrome P450